MKIVGRKIYVHFGNNTLIALERFKKGEFFSEALIDPECTLNGDRISVFNIWECNSGRTEIYVGKPAICDGITKTAGFTVGNLFTTKECWLIEEEMKNYIK